MTPLIEFGIIIKPFLRTFFSKKNPQICFCLKAKMRRKYIQIENPNWS